MIDRRTIVTGLVTALTARPLAAHAQKGRRVHRIGVLGLAMSSQLHGAGSSTQRAFLQGLRELGYVQDENFVVVARGSGGRIERFPELAAELVAEQVDVIVAAGGALPALKRATTTVPIVMAATNDPVAQGLVESLARPGGNITGLSLQSIETTAKRLELIKELVPGPAPIAFLFTAPYALHLQAARTAAQQRGWHVMAIDIQRIEDIERASVRAANLSSRSDLTRK
jgi:putative tryptophan/tyrosine transport system substrate-binding protein